jgi:hypothetical protein
MECEYGTMIMWIEISPLLGQIKCILLENKTYVNCQPTTYLGSISLSNILTCVRLKIIFSTNAFKLSQYMIGPLKHTPTISSNYYVDYDNG